VQDDLAKLGRVVVMMYVPPDEGETVAAGSQFYWEFSKNKTRRMIQVGEFLKDSKDAPDEGIKITDVRPKFAGTRRYEIVYEVYDDVNEPPVKEGVYLHDGAMKLDPAVQDRVRVPPAGGAAVPVDPVGGRETAGVVSPEAPGTPSGTSSGSAASRINPTVEWENGNSARVEFDQGTFDFFKGGDADTLASSVKTQEARDPQGNVIGLEITGLSTDTPADKFDIKPGDIVVSINDQAVKSRSDAINIAQGIDPDSTLVKVIVDRRGKLITFNIDPRDPKTRRRAATTMGRDMPER
jgi:membrane-associated protease RseP (regulator of RpoE activity)